MPNKPILNLSNIHSKVLDEIELLSDAYVSTFSEIGKYVKLYSIEINKTIEVFLNVRPLWKKYDSECYVLSYKPLTIFQGTEKFKIDVLFNSFTVDGQISVVKQSKDEKRNQLNYFSMNWGFYFDKDDSPQKYFYFLISRNAKKYGGAFLSLQEYAKILSEKDKINFEIHLQEHPGLGHTNETIELILNSQHINFVSDFFQFCKANLLEKFLSKIKD